VKAYTNCPAVPDFRSSTGLFNSLKAEHNLKGSGKDLFDASVYRDETSTSTFHSMVSSMSRMTKDAKPTVFHQMLATLAQEGRLLRLYTQNVDGIDTSLPPLNTVVPLCKDETGKWPKTVQLHGGLDKMVCSKCQTTSDLDADLFDGPIAPLCSACEEINEIRTNVEGKRSHGIGRLRPRMVLYNEHNPDDEAIGKVAGEDLRRRPDAIIVVGTTLKVPGIQRIVREMCGIVRDRKDGMSIWINNDPPPTGPQFADCWDLIVKGPADTVARHASLRNWDDPEDPAELDNISDEDEIRRALARKASVMLPVPTHLSPIPLPPNYLNNSFPPPATMPSTPHRLRANSRSPDFSPLTSRRSSIMPSIEETVCDDNITVAETGLLTPSKSQRSSPPALPSIVDKLKDTTKSKKPAPKKAKAAPKKKQTNVKYIKLAKSQAKTAAKPKISKGQPQKGKKASQTMSLSFTVSKAAPVDTAGKKKLGYASSPSKVLSKLSEVSNASPEALHPISRSDSRNNLSPTKSRPSFPNLTSPQKTAQRVKRTMSVASLVN
jgi:NAD-dependent histone deacetylase SIR2